MAKVAGESARTALVEEAARSPSVGVALPIKAKIEAFKLEIEIQKVLLELERESSRRVELENARPRCVQDACGTPERTIRQSDVHAVDNGVLGSQHGNVIPFARDTTVAPDEGQTAGDGQHGEPISSESVVPIAAGTDADDEDERIGEELCAHSDRGLGWARMSRAAEAFQPGQWHPEEDG